VLAVARPVDVLTPVDPWIIGRAVFHGHLPYRSFPFEYPPLAVAAFVLPALVPHGAAHLVLALQAVALELVVVAMLARWARPGTLRRYGMLSLLLFPLLAGGFDGVPMVALTAGTALVAAGSVGGWWVVAAGAAAKLSPGLIWVWGPWAPPPAVPAGRARSGSPARRRLLTAALALAVTGVVLLSPVALARHRDDDWLTYNLDRGVEVESMAASTAWLVHSAEGHPVRFPYRFRAVEIDHGAGAALVWEVLGALGLVAVALRARRAEPWLAALVTVDVFLMASKVFSPQYLVWAAPLAAVVGGELFVWHLVAAGLTVAVYALPLSHTAMLAVTAVRNLVILGAVGRGLARLWRPRPDGRDEGRPGRAGGRVASEPPL